VNPGSIVVSLNRLTLVAVQFMKTFNMEPHDAICAADQSYVVSLAPGERIDESKWFKGIIFMGKLKLVALPPGRASEAETVRRSTLMLRKDSEFTTNLTNITLDIPLPNEMKPRRSCRIATILDNAFEKVCSISKGYYGLIWLEAKASRVKRHIVTAYWLFLLTDSD